MNKQTRLQRQSWLGGIILLHLAAFLSWRSAPYVLPDGVHRESQLVFLQAPRAQPKPPLVVPAPAAASRRVAPPPPVTSVTAAPAAASTAAALAEAVTVPATDAAPDPFALPAQVAPTALERARHAAAGIDRQLRKESLNKFATIILPDTKLGMAIARSQKKDWVLEQTSDVGDGVTMKRYRRGNQEYCEYTNLVGARGQDPFRDGNKTKVMTCP